MLGSMLSIKPIISVIDGAVEPAGRVRTRSKALRFLVDQLPDGKVEIDQRVCTRNAPDLDEFLAMLEPIVPDAEVPSARSGRSSVCTPARGSWASLGSSGRSELVVGAATTSTTTRSRADAAAAVTAPRSTTLLRASHRARARRVPPHSRQSRRRARRDARSAARDRPQDRIVRRPLEVLDLGVPGRDERRARRGPPPRPAAGPVRAPARAERASAATDDRGRDRRPPRRRRRARAADPRYRAAVALRDLVGMDYAEIAEVLGIPAGTVRSRISRGRAALADLLGNRETRPNIQPTERHERRTAPHPPNPTHPSRPSRPPTVGAVDPLDERLSAALDGESAPRSATRADQADDRRRALAAARDLLAVPPPPLDDIPAGACCGRPSPFGHRATHVT